MTPHADDTIFALSSGRLPAGIAVLRVSGPQAAETLRRLTGSLPPPRRAVVRTISDGDDILDRALLLWLPGPETVTGEDVAEYHLHGSRAVVAGVEHALGRICGVRMAEAGEFSRRALLNGRMDLVETEGLGDLLAAETATQRRAALALAGGALSRDVERWRETLVACAARIEAALDQGEEDEVASATVPLDRLAALHDEIAARLARPGAERLRDGVRVVLAGPPNSGKSSLLNALAERDAAIVTDIAGTTRDVIEVPLAIDGVAFVLSDTAGLRITDDAIERIGVDRSHAAMAGADIILWLGDDAAPAVEAATLPLHARADLPERGNVPLGRLAISTVGAPGLDELRAGLVETAGSLLPLPGEAALNRRHRALLTEAVGDLTAAMMVDDLLIVAEHTRSALSAFQRLTGSAGVEDVLDQLFATFCLGK